MDNLVQFQSIFKDNLAVKIFAITTTIVLLTFMFSTLMGLFLTLIFIISLSAAIHTVQSPSMQKRFQDVVISFVQQPNHDKEKEVTQRTQNSIRIAKDLNDTLENFLNRLLDQFITSWFSDVSSDTSFLCNIKLEIAQAARNLANRCNNIDYPMLVTTKLLPVVYTHFTEIKHSIKLSTIDEQVQSYLADSHQIHPAVVNRKAEIRYLRSLSESIIQHLFTNNNLSCKSTFTIVRELFTNWIFLQITDIIAEPDIINTLVILATNPKSNPIKELKNWTEVEILENYAKQLESNENLFEQPMDGNFFNDQEKLYNFMQFLKTQNCKDVEILKFVLDVDHLNRESEKKAVMEDASKLSSLQQLSEKLLTLYRDNLFPGNATETRPNDLTQCYSHARKYLEDKWKYDFYKSADYYKYIYGDRDLFNTFKQEEDMLSMTSGPSADISSQKLAARIKSAMSMKIAVDGIGIEEGDIQVYDALDVINPVSPFNSMAVRLRKEKGQDLDNFMKVLYQSIEQEGDLGEDIMHTQSKQEKQKRNKMKFGNIELYKNLFNLSGQSSTEITISSFIKTPTQSLLYFLAEIIKFNDLILRIVTGLLNALPNSDLIICMSIRKLVEKLVNQSIMAHLIKELEEKIFDDKDKSQPTLKELSDRRNLAMERLDKIKNGLSNNLMLLQNPIFNKHLAYCLLDTVIIEAFKELDPNNAGSNLPK